MHTSALIRVLIADDHAFMRSGLAFMINHESDMEVVAEAADGEAALQAFNLCKPDVSILDLRMPKLDGISTTRAIKQIDSKARIIVLSTATGDVQIVRSYAAGASAYISKDAARLELAEAIRIVASGGKRANDLVAQQIARYSQSDDLSVREIDVLKHAAKGLSNKRIADALGLTENTIKGYLANTLHKLEAQDRTHAVTIAISRGYFDLDRHHG